MYFIVDITFHNIIFFVHLFICLFSKKKKERIWEINFMLLFSGANVKIDTYIAYIIYIILKP